MVNLEDLKFSKEHEWIKSEDDSIVILGITDYAQDSLGDIVYVEMPEVGTQITADEIIGTVESVKAVSDIYTPLSGVVVELNSELNDSPEFINSDPYGKGWLLKIKINSDDLNNPSLMDSTSYNEFLNN